MGQTGRHLRPVQPCRTEGMQVLPAVAHDSPPQSCFVSARWWGQCRWQVPTACGVSVLSPPTACQMPMCLAVEGRDVALVVIVEYTNLRLARAWLVFIISPFGATGFAPGLRLTTGLNVITTPAPRKGRIPSAKCPQKRSLSCGCAPPLRPVTVSFPKWKKSAAGPVLLSLSSAAVRINSLLQTVSLLHLLLC